MQTARILLFVTCLAALAACERSPRELRLVTPVSPIDRDIVEDLGELFDNERVLRQLDAVGIDDRLSDA